MSTDVMNRVWWREDIPTTEKFVLVALADASNDDGYCWMAIATIGVKTGLARRTIQRDIRALEAKQLLRIVERQDRSSVFILNLTNLPLIERSRSPKETMPEFAFATGAPHAPVVEMTGAQDAQTGAPHARTGACGAPRNITETSEETPSGLFGDLQSPEPQESVVQFVERRWGEITASNPGIAKIRKIDPGLAKTIEDRGRTHARDGETPIAVWEAALRNVETSTFLRGLAPPGKGRLEPFRLSIGWMSKASNFREILGGRYNGERSPNLVDESTGRQLGPTDQALRGSIARFRNARERTGGGGSNPGGHHLAIGDGRCGRA